MNGGAGGGNGAAGAGGAAATGGTNGMYAIPVRTLPGLTFYGCDGTSRSIVGAYNDHGVAFTMTGADLQPNYPFATTPILRGTSPAGIAGDDGTIFPNMSTITGADLFGSFATYNIPQRLGTVFYFFVGAGGTILNQLTNALVTSPTTKDLYATNGINTGFGDGWAVGADATIIYWNSSQWLASTHPAEPGITLRGVSEAAPNDVWAVGDMGHALHWDGTTWTSVATGTTVNLNAVTHGPAQSGFLTTFYAAGDAGVLLKWDGFSWTSIASPTSQPLYALCLSDSGQLVAGGAGGAYRTSRETIQWSPYPLNLGTPASSTAIAAASAQDVWAAYSAGTTSQIFHFDGQGWTLVSFLQHHDIARIVLTPGGNVWFYGPHGGDVYSNGAFQSANQLWGAGPAVAPANDDVWALADNGGGSVSQGDGTTSHSPAGPANAMLVDIAARAPNDIWAITINELWHWDGTTWTLRPISMPTGEVGLFQQVRLTASDVWIRTQRLVLKWTGTALTQWSLPTGGGPSPLGQTRFIPLGDNDIWISGPSGAFRWNGTSWTSATTSPILDLSGDATRIWATTSTTILDFPP